MKKKLRVTVEGKAYEVEVEEMESSGAVATRKSVQSKESHPSPPPQAAAKKEELPSKPAKPSAKGEQVSAPIPGKVLSIQAKVGAQVSSGEQLLVLEAMKMENEIAATAAGEIKEILVVEGQTVQTGDVLVVIG